MTGNGNHVTWRELNLALEPIKEDVREIKAELHQIADSQWLGPQGRTFISGAGLVSAVAAILISVFH